MSEASSGDEWVNTNSGDMICRRDGLVTQRGGSGHWDKTENWHDSGKNWSNVLYLQTPPLEDDVGTLCISTEAKDQGWGNTNYSRVMVSVWKDSKRIASAKFDTVSYNWKRTDKKWSINSENAEQANFVSACTRGSTIALSLASPPYGGHECHGRRGHIVFCSRYKHRRAAVLLHALVQRQNVDFNDFNEDTDVLSFVFGGNNSRLFCPEEIFRLIVPLLW